MTTPRKSAATVQTPGKVKPTRATRTSGPAAQAAAANPDADPDADAGEPTPVGGVAALAAARFTDEDVDPTTLSAAVMTPDGWLCPEPKPAKA